MLPVCYLQLSVSFEVVRKIRHSLSLIEEDLLQFFVGNPLSKLCQILYQWSENPEWLLNLSKKTINNHKMHFKTLILSVFFFGVGNLRSSL